MQHNQHDCSPNTQIAFGSGSGGVRAFHSVVDAMFWLDILINFRTAVIDSHRRLVTDRAAIAVAYARGWLALDVVSSVPWGAIIDAAAAAGGLGATHKVRGGCCGCCCCFCWHGAHMNRMGVSTCL